MATKTKKAVEVETNGAEERNPLFENVRKVVLAGIGAVALAQDEVEEFIDRLVERGEIAEKDGKKLVREVIDRRKKDAQKAEDEIGKRVEDALGRMSIPAKADIDALSDKIAALSKKIDELKKTQA